MRSFRDGARLAAVAAIVVCIVASTAVSFAQVQPRMAAGYQLPVIFEPNVGQADARVKFLSRERDGVLFIASDEAVLAVSSPALVPMRGARTVRVAPPMHSGGVLTMRLVGANPDATVEGRGRALARINYFVGRDPSRWHTNIPTVNEVVAHEAWPGIDVSYSRDRSASPEAVECTFTVRAGANPSAVRLAFDAPAEVELTHDGDVETLIGIRKIKFTKPRVFEEGVDGRREVSAKFVAVPSDRRTNHVLEVRFEVARRDPGARLVIDPSLVYSTYLGGSGQANATTTFGGTGDSVNAMAIDKDGNEYLTGGTTSPDFAATNEAFVSSCKRAYNCGDPAFVTKLDGKTGEIVYSTLLGGGAGIREGVGDEGNGIAVDQFGNAYVAGATASNNFPTTPGAFITSCDGCNPAPFVTKLSADGSSLVYSTFLERSGVGDFGNAIAIDESGNAYVTGVTSLNAFAAVLNQAGSALTYAVALASAEGYAVALTSKHQMWIGGLSFGGDFPVTNNALQRKCKKCSSAGFVALLDPAKGSTRASLLYATYIGGTKSSDSIRGIAVDGKNRAWAVGAASPASFKGNESEVNCPKGTKCGDHALLAIVDASRSGGASLALSEYFGGSGSDRANAIYLVGSVAYIGGQTTSPNFPVTSNAVQSSYAPCIGCEPFRGPAFVAVVNPTAKKKPLLYSTYLGGATVISPSYVGARGIQNLVEVDAVNGIAVDRNGLIRAAGLTYASGFPTTNGAPQTVCKACMALGSDGFVARINPNASSAGEALVYSSFIGGSGPRFSGDSAAGVAMDTSGAVYVAGATASPDFPVTVGAYQQNCAGCVGIDVGGFPVVGTGAFVAKLNPAAAVGDQLVYATYLDGTSSDEGTDVAASGISVDSIGEAYIVGVAYSSNFPTTPNAYSNSCSASECIFFAKLDSTGSSLLYSSFIGGGSKAAVAVDPQNNALVAGTTKGNIPTTPGALQSTCGACSSGAAGFFSKISPNNSGAASLIYSTYISGSGGKFGANPVGDSVFAVASDTNGNAVLTGQATSPDFPITSNAYQSVCQGVCASPFVSVIDPSLSGAASLPYSTYLNGNGGISNAEASGFALAVDANHDIYVGGTTIGYNFPVSPNTFIPQCPALPCGGGSGFIAELNPNAAPANQLVYGTYLGGTSSIGNEAVTGLGVDSNGRIYAAGHTLSADFPVTMDAAQPTCLSCPGALQDEGNDGFLSVLDPAMSGGSQLVYSTFLGGSNYDAATSLALGPMGLVTVAGYSSSTDFPTTANAFELECPACRNTGSSLGSNSDAFVSVFQF
jgi:Beta-propeller repeat